MNLKLLCAISFSVLTLNLYASDLPPSENTIPPSQPRTPVLVGDASMNFFDLITAGVAPKVAEYMIDFECTEEEAKKALSTQLEAQLKDNAWEY